MSHIVFSYVKRNKKFEEEEDILLPTVRTYKLYPTVHSDDIKATVFSAAHSKDT